MKLNLGCGFKKLPGYVNVDLSSVCEPDQVFDLENTPWPWENDSVEEIMLDNVLEHLGQTSQAYLAIIKELYRICQAGAKISIKVPHHRHDSAVSDPTHVRMVTVSEMNLYDREKNLEWRKAGIANTPLALYLGVDFKLQDVSYQVDPQFSALVQTPEGRQEFQHLVQHQNNVVESVSMVLVAQKSH
jgi:hypothetical protein